MDRNIIRWNVLKCYFIIWIFNNGIEQKFILLFEKGQNCMGYIAFQFYIIFLKIYIIS